jgi:benzodiazapine receptor
MSKALIRQILVVAATLATIVVNGLANSLPLNGQRTGDISDRFDIYFVPAGYVFSIWGLIYLLLIAYTIFQALPAQRDNPVLDAVGYLYVFSALANIAWLFLWHYEKFPLTLPVMLALLGLLIAIYLKLDIGRAEVPVTFSWLVHLPFSIYLGWITVATIANASQLLTFLNWNGWGISPEAWTVIMLGAAAIITGAMLITRADVAYGLVIIWAVIGIASKHSEVPPVATAGWVVVVLVALLVAVQVVSPNLLRFGRG